MCVLYTKYHISYSYDWIWYCVVRCSPFFILNTFLWFTIMVWLLLFLIFFSNENEKERGTIQRRERKNITRGFHTKNKKVHSTEMDWEKWIIFPPADIIYFNQNMNLWWIFALYVKKFLEIQEIRRKKSATKKVAW